MSLATPPISTPQQEPQAGQLRVPPLENGDHLSQPEFHRRYLEMPEVKKAELIEGIVYMPSPVSLNHLSPHYKLITLLGAYSLTIPQLISGDNGTVILDNKNEVQPDIMLAISESAGGSSKIVTRTENNQAMQYLVGAPEFVAEIAASSVSIDLHTKREVYERIGVRNYLVWLTQDNAMRLMSLTNGQLIEVQHDEPVLSIESMPGLRINRAAILKGDLAAAMKTVTDAAASEEAVAFRKRLHDAGASSK